MTKPHAPATQGLLAHTLTQQDKTFYPILGPYFVDAEVRRATGSPMTSTAEHRWTVVTQGRQVMAFAGLLPHKNGSGEFVAVYAVNGDSTAKQLALEGAISDARVHGLREVRIMAKLENAELYRRLGFQDGPIKGAFRQFIQGL